MQVYGESFSVYRYVKNYGAKCTKNVCYKEHEDEVRQIALV